MKLIVSPQVIADIKEIKDYISNDLNNPAAAGRIADSIRSTYKKLKNNPYIGTALSAKVDIENDYRYLVCGNYLIFHRVYENKVRIERVIYGKRDYMRLIFGNDCPNTGADEEDNIE